MGATGTVTWNFGTFTNALLGANNNTLRIIYTARVTDNGTGALATTPTTVALNNSAGVSFVNSSSVSIAAGPATSSLNVEQPLLTIAKTRLTPVATNVVRPGDTVSFSLTVTNTGAAPAYNVAVQDLIPSGMRSTTPVLNSATLNGVNILSTLNVPGWNSGTGAWTFALVDAQFNVGGQIEYILPGQTLVLNYTVTVDNNSGLRGSTLNNSATVQAYYSQLVSNPTQRRTYSSVGPVTQAIIIGLNVDGYVFNDLIANGVKDTGEDWTTGTPVYVNVVDTGTGMVVASDSIPIGNGYYSFTALAPGTYNFVLTTSSGSTTATAPATWMFRAPVGGSLPITLTTSDLTGQNFGLFQGHTLSGRVFRDNGIGGGTANDGVINGTEAGIGNVTVLLLSSSFTQLANAVTDGGGNFVLHIPVGTATGATLVVQEINPPVYVSTGGNSGGNGGTYDRSTDRIAFTYAGNDPTGFQFGDIPEDSLLTDGAQVILPGAVAYYRHTYTAGTAGTVTFTVSTQATPSIPWTQVIVRDLNGNGQIDAGEPVINGTPITVAAGDVINLVVKENSPSGTPLGARDTITLSSTFTAANASPAIVFNRTRQDVTTIGTTTAAGLQLTKSVDKTTAAPGDVITYTITYTNVGSESLSVFFINDITPAYTTFVSAAAGALPLNLTAVVITKPTVGAAGPLRWDFTGTLAPGSSGTVTFQVQVQL